MALHNIVLSNSGVDGLQASWRKPPGDVDSYTLTLLQDRCVYRETRTVMPVCTK